MTEIFLKATEIPQHLLTLIHEIIPDMYNSINMQEIWVMNQTPKSYICHHFVSNNYFCSSYLSSQLVKMLPMMTNHCANFKRSASSSDLKSYCWAFRADLTVNMVTSEVCIIIICRIGVFLLFTLRRMGVKWVNQRFKKQLSLNIIINIIFFHEITSCSSLSIRHTE